MGCKVSWVMQSDIECKYCDICRIDPKQYISEHPEILESKDAFGNQNFIGEEDAKLWLNTKLKATAYCETHDNYLCNKCVSKCGKENEEFNEHKR